MKITRITDIEPTLFNNDVAKGVEGRVLIGKKSGAENFCMRVFKLEKDGHTPKHSHDWEHEIFVHSGSGSAFNGETWTDVGPGCSIFIPGNEEHQMKNTGEAPFVFVCLVPSSAPEL